MSIASGTKVEFLRQRYEKLVFQTESAFLPAVATGSGSRFYDHDGHEHVDFSAALACLPFGFGDLETISIIQRQAEKLVHSGTELLNEESLLLLGLFDDLRPGQCYFFSSSGAEANEAALKLARKYHSNRRGKSTLVAMSPSFHGRTLLNVSLSANHHHVDGYEPLVEGVNQVPYNEPEILLDSVGPDTCAIIVETLQGKGGGHELSQRFVEALHEARDRTSCLLIVDDIQAGLGRQGSFFGHDSYGLDPDIITMAKGLAGGLPIGLTIARKEIAVCMGPGSHGNTFGGNPLAAATAASIVERTSKADFLSQVRQKGQFFLERLMALDFFVEVRGRGLILVADLPPAAKGLADALKGAATQVGLEVRTCGDSMLRFTPALNIPEPDIDEGICRLARAIDKLMVPPKKVLGTPLLGRTCERLSNGWTRSSIESELSRQVSANMSPVVRAARWVSLFEGTPFEFESRPSVREFGVSTALRTFDCITLVYHVLALAVAQNYEEYCERLRVLRYRHSRNSTIPEPAAEAFIDYACEAILKNGVDSGILRDRTASLGAPTMNIKMSLASTRRPRDHDSDETIVHPQYPDWQVDAEVIASADIQQIDPTKVENGDLVLFTRGTHTPEGSPRPMFVYHAGFIRKFGREIGLVHATQSYYVSSEARHLKLLPGTQACYLPGVVIAGTYLGDDAILEHNSRPCHGYDLDKPRSLASYASNFAAIKVLRAAR
ncbi:aminotransferase class III-fold pyridoxal phosphate-dependent enzyme [Roseibium album]|uniref:aminotransferase class III-fold pyridoxal phosphate-dependent enzyme n=1 Tax=Roseibium album TaxID=311410 RepID=UPI00248F9A34|nr:aminotransferase class III-fold pyridoxal phosphate-dependent enzyme [Roseibium album]